METCVLTVTDAHAFSDGVHRELGASHVNGFHAGGGTNHGSNGGSTGAVVADHKLLEGWQSGAPRNLAHNESGNGIGGVTLVAVALNDHSLVEFGLVGLFVLG